MGNYARRDGCNKCQTLKPGLMMGGFPGGFGGVKGGFMPPGMGAMMPAGGMIGNFRPGAWVCAKCANHNYSNREVCNKCQSPKMPRKNMYGACKGSAGMAGCYAPYPSALPMANIAGNMRPGDWLCP